MALADRSNTDRERCLRLLEEQTDALALPITVLAEACYLIDRFGGSVAEARFLDSVGSEPHHRFRPLDLADADLRRMSELVRQYGDRRMGGTDDVKTVRWRGRMLSKSLRFTVAISTSSTLTTIPA